MVVAMHEHDRLGERFVAEPVESRRDDGALALVRREREVARQEPFREQLEFAHQEVAVVGRQLRRGGARARLHEHERIHGIRVERLGDRRRGRATRGNAGGRGRPSGRNPARRPPRSPAARARRSRRGCARRAAMHRGLRVPAARPSRSASCRRDARGNSAGSSRRRTRARCVRWAGRAGPRSIVPVCSAADRRCRSLSCRGDGRGARIIDFPTPVISRRIIALLATTGVLPPAAASECMWPADAGACGHSRGAAPWRRGEQDRASSRSRCDRRPSGDDARRRCKALGRRDHRPGRARGLRRCRHLRRVGTALRGRGRRRVPLARPAPERRIRKLERARHGTVHQRGIRAAAAAGARLGGVARDER